MDPIEIQNQLLREQNQIMIIQNGLILATIAVALLSPLFFDWLRNQKLKDHISFILFSHLCQLREVLKRIRDRRDGNCDGKERIVFSETSLSEIKSEFYLYDDVFLKNLEVFGNLEKYSNVTTFFRNYKCNLETLLSRLGNHNHDTWLGRGSVENLLGWLQNAIDEVRQEEKRFIKIEKDIINLIRAGS